MYKIRFVPVVYSYQTYCYLIFLRLKKIQILVFCLATNSRNINQLLYKGQKD
jgi:hypothetical protein